MKNKNYDIDFELFTVEEVVKIVGFFKLIEDAKTKRIDKDLLIRKYKEYRSIINSIALEKKYDRMLYEKSGVSIYHTIKNLH
ncbi:MAG TPA: UPF0223 family protein [Acholeplasmataceae bacterium]|nr:UPF0223 family protein [Acholeplasmataceae bacterium]